MKVTILFFAALRDLTGRDHDVIELSSTMRTVGDVHRYVEERYEVLRERLGSVRFAKNEEFVEREALVADGDVIALIPPVSGG